jgi:hypothetical protein
MVCNLAEAFSAPRPGAEAVDIIRELVDRATSAYYKAILYGDLAAIL